MEKITIVMLQHNRSDYTSRTLHSLYNNTNIPDFKCIIGDAGSNISEISSLLKEKELYSKYNNFEIILLDNNESIGVNKNSLIEKVDTEYIGVFDNDMEYNENWLNKSIELYEKNNIDLLGLWKHPLHQVVSEEDDVFDMNNIAGNCWLSRTNLYQRYGLLKEISVHESLTSWGEDSEFIFRLKAENAKVRGVKQNLLEHFGKIRSDGTNSSDINHIKV